MGKYEKYLSTESMNREKILNRQDPAWQKRLHPCQGVQAGLALEKTGILSGYSSVSFFLGLTFLLWECGTILNEKTKLI